MIAYDDRSWLFLLLFQRKGSVVPRTVLFAIPSALLALTLLVIEDFWPAWRTTMDIDDIQEGKVWSATMLGLSALLGFRIKQSLGRFWEGTSLLHQMQGEWFESASCLFAFSRSTMKTKRAECISFRHTLVRLVSLLHGSALEEIKEDATVSYEVFDIHGLDNSTLRYLQRSKADNGFNRVQVILHMIQVLMTANLDSGVLKIPPPILSRVYQTFSRGLVNLLNAKKITDTLFPFPFAQTITVMLMFQVFFTPFMITAIVTNKLWAMLLTFVPIFGVFSLNFSASELEMPFGDDDNDLPLWEFQAEMNLSLMMLFNGSAPGEAADHLPGCKASVLKQAPDELVERMLHGEKSGTSQQRLVSSNTKELDSFSVVDDEPEKDEPEKAPEPPPPPPAPAPAPAPVAAPAPAPSPAPPAPIIQPSIPDEVVTQLDELATRWSERVGDQAKVAAENTEVLRSLSFALTGLVSTLERSMGDLDRKMFSWGQRVEDQSRAVAEIANALGACANALPAVPRLPALTQS